jgi:hypothetical protein
MSGKRVLFWVVLLVACGSWAARDGAVWRANLDGDGPHVLLGLLAGYLCFLWYVADSDERGFRRPRWLGAAMILLTPVAVPWYLIRTRDGRARAQALLGYAGALGLCVVAAWGAAALRLSA